MKNPKMSNWQALKKVIKIRNLFGLILLLIANSLAWFIYANQVDNEMSAHVRAWNVIFKSGESPIVDFVSVNVESMYPGMENFLYEMGAYNRSEVSASIDYTLMEANIMGTHYVTVEGRAEYLETVLPTDLTSDELIEKLEEDYPFTITFNLTNSEMEPEVGETTYEIHVVWPYESGNDAADTYWGMKAADYKVSYPTQPSIKLKIKIVITQQPEP